MLTEGGWCDSDLDPRLLYRQLICAARGVNVKIPWLFAFIQTRGRRPLLGVEAKERNIYKEAGHYSNRNMKFEGEPALQRRRQYTRRTRRR